MTVADMLNLLALVVVNVCGYVALGDRLKRVEVAIDTKASKPEVEAVKTRVQALEDAA